MSLAWDEARKAAYGLAQPLPAADLPLYEALGTTLARTVRALAPAPAFDMAAMDGYACAGPGPWLLAGGIRAGERPLTAALRSGTAVEIATGAAVPEGTTAVLPYELSRRTGDRVSGELEAGRHIRRAGEEYAAGEAVIPCDTAVTPPVLGLAAAMGHDTLRVRRAPRANVLVTGDELLTSGLPGAGRIRDALGPMLPGVVTGLGGRLASLRHVRDDRTRLRDALAASDGDVLVVTGASSAGPADHLRSVLRGLGAEIAVDGVACRPGHPACLATLPDGRPLVGLPGNPLAALVAAATLLAPLLDGLRGLPPAADRLAANGGVRVHERVTRLEPVRVRDGRAVPVARTGSAMLRGIAFADALAVVDPDAPADRPVRLLPLPWLTEATPPWQRSAGAPQGGPGAADRA